jgi:hypothetical protein
MNHFAYVMNNPVMWIDPYGLEVKLCHGPVEHQLLPSFADHYWLKTDKYESGKYGNEWVDHTGKSTVYDESDPPVFTCEIVENVDEDVINDIIKPGNTTTPWMPIIYDCRVATEWGI